MMRDTMSLLVRFGANGDKSPYIVEVPPPKKALPDSFAVEARDIGTLLAAVAAVGRYVDANTFRNLMGDLSLCRMKTEGHAVTIY